MEKFGGISQTQYLEQANESLVTIVQIETREALENVCIVFPWIDQFRLKRHHRLTPSPKFQGLIPCLSE